MLQVQERVRPTLKRTKFACVNCKAAKAACDSNRPCAWCIRHSLQDSCVDAPRKVRTSKKICCDPSLHAKAIALKQENKGEFQLSLGAEFTPTTAIPLEPPLSPPSDIFPIEDLLVPTFDFGLTNSSNQPCTNCPLYLTCAKDAPQRLICATSTSPPQSPLTPEHDDEPFTATSPTTFPPISLANHPEFSIQLKQNDIDTSPQPIFSMEAQLTPQFTSQQLSPPVLLTPQMVFSPPQFVFNTPASTVAVQPRNLQGCCSFSTSPHLPPLIDDICNCQSLVQKEMAKINASLETISALMQLQNGPLIPTATFRVPDTTIEDCNDEFAKALGYDSRDDLLAISLIDEITISTQQMMQPQQGEYEEIKPVKKPLLSTLIPEKWAPGLLKCANELQKATLPMVNQIAFTSKRGDSRFFTALIKPCGWFSYISLLKQHTQMIEGLVVCGE